MTYSHMPFFHKDSMFLCVGGEVQLGKFRPWQMSLQVNGDIIPVDFPEKEVSYRKRHCSPIFTNGVLSVTYDSKVFCRTNGKWESGTTMVQQGYWSGTHLTHCHGKDLFINEDRTNHPFEKLLRIAPVDGGHVVTGYTGHKAWSALLKDGRWHRISIDGEDVYKCHIQEGKIAHAKFVEKGIECYQVQISDLYDLHPI